MWWYNFLDVFGYKIDIFHISWAIALISPMVVFTPKFFSKCKFRTYYNLGSSNILIESLKFRNNSRIAVSSPSNLLWKLGIWFFLILYCYCFSLEAVLQAMA